MPPFRFYVFISFIFFLLLNSYSSQITKNGQRDNNLTIFGNVNSNHNPTDSLNTIDVSVPVPEAEREQLAKMELFNEHPELFIEQMLSNLSWAMFFLMPLYACLLWLFFRKAHKFYITHLILAINQHAFMFIILSIVLSLALLLPDFSQSFRNYFVLLIPVYFFIGQKVLYQQKAWKIILKMFLTGLIYSIIIFTVSIALIVLVAVQNGIAI